MAPHGVWGIPVGLGYLPGAQTSLTWSQSVRTKRDDPEVDLDTNHRWLGAAGISYAFPSRWQIMVSGVYVGSADTSARWAARPHDYGYVTVKESQPEVRTTGSNWGVMATVVIPLGGGK